MTITSIIEVFAATGAALGTWKGVEWILKRWFPTKHEKRQEESTTKQSEVSVEKALRAMFEEERKALRDEYESRLKEQREDFEARYNALRESNEYLNHQNTELLKAGARKDDIIDDKVNKIRQLEESRVQDQKEIGRLSRLCLFYRSWHCEREFGSGKEDCKRRKPAQNPPLKYIAIDDDESSSSGIFIRGVAPELKPKGKAKAESENTTETDKDDKSTDTSS